MSRLSARLLLIARFALLFFSRVLKLTSCSFVAGVGGRDSCPYRVGLPASVWPLSGGLLPLGLRSHTVFRAFACCLLAVRIRGASSFNCRFGYPCWSRAPRAMCGSPGYRACAATRSRLPCGSDGRPVWQPCGRDLREGREALVGAVHRPAPLCTAPGGGFAGRKLHSHPSAPPPAPIGATGFEPATARPPAECATRLRHAPLIRQGYPRVRPSGRRESNPP